MRNAEVIPYLTGGVFFLVGTTLQVHASWKTNHSSETHDHHDANSGVAGAAKESPYDSHLKRNKAKAEKEYVHLYHAGDTWTRRRRALDLVHNSLIGFSIGAFPFFFCNCWLFMAFAVRIVHHFDGSGAVQSDADSATDRHHK